MSKDQYPTWVRISNRELVSEEERDGTPDFYIFKVRGKWYVKWRTCAHTNREAYDSASKAIKAVEASLPPAK